MTVIELFRHNPQYRKLLVLWGARSIPANALSLLLLWTAIHNDSILRGGIVVAVQALASMMVPFVFAWLSDHTGRRVPLLVGASAELLALPMVLITATTGTVGPIIEVAAFVSAAGTGIFLAMLSTTAVDVATSTSPNSGAAAAIGVGFAADIPKLASVSLIWLLISHNGPIVAAVLSVLILAGFPLAHIMPNAKIHREAVAAVSTSLWSVSNVLPGLILIGVAALIPWTFILVAVPPSAGWLAVDLAAAFSGAVMGTVLLAVTKPPTIFSTSIYVVVQVLALFLAVVYPGIAPIAFAVMGLGAAANWQSIRAVTVGVTPLHRRGFVDGVSSVIVAIVATAAGLGVAAGFETIGSLLTVAIVAVAVLVIVGALNVWLSTGSHSHRLGSKSPSGVDDIPIG